MVEEERRKGFLLDLNSRKMIYSLLILYICLPSTKPRGIRSKNNSLKPIPLSSLYHKCCYIPPFVNLLTEEPSASKHPPKKKQ